MSFILYYVSFGYYNPYPVEKPKSKYTFTINDDYINIRKNLIFNNRINRKLLSKRCSFFQA